ncbi:ABC transporter permease [Johnsonella ignava]|nr:ABC transporter permease subunit [Johnsonella ignava]
MLSSSYRNMYKKTAAVLFALLFWQLTASAIGQSILIAGPFEVLNSLTMLIRTKEFYLTVIHSFSGISLGFIYAFVLASILGFISYKYDFFSTLLYPYVLMTKSVPVASFVILALMYVGSGNLSIFISFIMVFPIIYTNILGGFKAVDIKLLEFAKVYGIKGFRKFRYIYFPEMFEHIYSALKAAAGIAWKAGVAAEIIGLSRNSIGFKLYESKLYFSITDLFAWTLVIILLSLGFEKLCVFILRTVYRYACNK